MCQSKANGGKRCAYHSKGNEHKRLRSNRKNVDVKVTVEPKVNGDLEIGELFTCSLCALEATRGSGDSHRCFAPNLVPLTSAAYLVVETIINAGGKPLIVGGSVRDAILAKGERHTPKDVDIEVYGLSVEALIKALRPIGKVGDVGKAFNVIKLIVEKEDFDISLPRVDTKVGEGHRGFKVEADHSLSEATAFGRRDFTVNALGWDPKTHELVDPYGGSADLEAKVLRHTTQAFSEDPLRVMRAIQFAGRFGFTIAPETIIECRSLIESYLELPTERIWTEWEKVAVKAPHPSKSLQALFDTGWEKHFPELTAIRGVIQGEDWHPEGSVDIHTAMAADKAAMIAERENLSDEDRLTLFFAAVTHDFGKATHTVVSLEGKVSSQGHAEAGEEPAKKFLQSIGAPQSLQHKVAILVKEHMAHVGIQGEPSAMAVRRLIRRLDANGNGVTLEAWAHLVEADTSGRGKVKDNPALLWLKKASELGESKPVKSIIRGEDLSARGMPPGVKYKGILAAAVSAQDDGLFSNRQEADSWLDQYLKDNF